MQNFKKSWRNFFCLPSPIYQLDLLGPEESFVVISSILKISCRQQMFRTAYKLSGETTVLIVDCYSMLFLFYVLEGLSIRQM